MNATGSDLKQALTASPYITQAELADEFGMTIKQVSLALKHHGLQTARATKIIIPRADIEGLLDKYPGIGVRGIAAEIGVSRGVIQRAMREYGLKTSKTHISEKRVRDAFKAGATTPYKMSKRLGVDWTTARRWMVKLGMIEGESDRAELRATLPVCRACGDPVDPADQVWGGEGDLHYLCAAHQERLGTVVYDKWSADYE